MQRSLASLLLFFPVVVFGSVNGMSSEESIFNNPLHIDAAKAARKGDIVRLEQLIKSGLDVNLVSQDSKTPWGRDNITLLLWAALNDSTKGAETLLKAGADPNKATRRGVTPLMIASTSKSDELFELFLVKYKSDPNKSYNLPISTALSMVLAEGTKLGEKRFKRAENLLRHGADIDFRFNKGDTALIDLTTQGYWRAVYWLLEHGANYELRNRLKVTMMCYLRNSYRANTLAPSEAYTYRDKTRDWLLAHGVARSRLDPALHPSPKCDD